MNECVNRCEVALNRYANRGPGVLVAELEDLHRRIQHAQADLVLLMKSNPSALTQSHGRSLFEVLLVLLQRSERIWFNFLTKKQKASA
jgi:hypothetical protein